ncbi:hypothetical protein HXA35_16190 [Bacillus sp. A301a_S52]|nr:hypothetical protein [Bacillus sp. A301a_S52]
MESKGKKHWFIPDGYIPEHSSGEVESHEAICVLNCHSEPAHLSITIYFEDREPLDKVSETIPGRRTKHIRTNSLHNSENRRIPVGVPYALEITSDRPVIIQYSRLDSSQKALALMTTIGYA